MLTMDRLIEGEAGAGAPLTPAEKRDARRAAKALEKLAAEDRTNANDGGSMTVTAGGKSATVTGEQLATAAHTLRVHGVAQQHGIPADIADQVAKQTDPSVIRPAATNAQLIAFVERIENINAEIAERMGDRKEIFLEAKNIGFDLPTLRKVVALRGMDQDKRLEAEALLETYKRGVGLPTQTEMGF